METEIVEDDLTGKSHACEFCIELFLLELRIIAGDEGIYVLK